jgi:hypothetical protein
MKMRTLIKVIIILLISQRVFASDIFEDISNAIRNGESHQLSTYFGNTVDLTILEQENVYSKAQAELVIKDFFEKNRPKSFTILHKGSSPEKTQYAIGNLVTSNGRTFRVSFYIKNTQGKNLLQELRIETE